MRVLYRYPHLRVAMPSRIWLEPASVMALDASPTGVYRRFMAIWLKQQQGRLKVANDEHFDATCASELCNGISG